MRDHTPTRCGVCKVKHFERNNYFHGKMLSPRDLAAEQAYLNEKRWLINRMVIGWGIVCGLEVRRERGCLVLAPGLALDCCGREILLCEPYRIPAADIAHALGLEGETTGQYEPPSPPYEPPAEQPPEPGQYPRPDAQSRESEYPPDYEQSDQGESYPDPEAIPWALCLEYRECGVEPVHAGSPHRHGKRGEYNRVRDSYRVSIRPRADVCADDHSEDTCPHQGLGAATPIHQALVTRSRTCPSCRDCDCVLLASGTVTRTAGRPPEIALDPDAWKYIRIVHTNPALGGLIRCLHGGLPHISGMNWRPWDHYGPDEFLDRLAREHLRVTFDQPMNEYSVRNVRTCRLSIYLSNENRCPAPLHIPVDHIEYEEGTATYYFDDDCIEHELRKACKRLRRPADVELVLHGSMIHSQSGRALDAELIHDFPTGNGVEGGDFVTYFTVGP